MIGAHEAGKECYSQIMISHAQVPILLSSAAFLAASVVEVAAYSAAGAYVGFLYGSTLGTLQMLRWSYASTVKLPVRALTLACIGACR